MTSSTPSPVWLYRGRTVHERRAPFLHRFSYRISSILIDLEQLEAADQVSTVFSVNRFNLYSFNTRDHGPRNNSCLLDWARGHWRKVGVNADAARVRLLCAPRVLGYVFNPLSVYFATDDYNRLIGVIYQVHNTFGDAHAYVASCSNAPVQHQEADKAFHVSPFFDMGGRYEFTLRAPDTRFRLTIFKQREQAPDFLATMTMNRSALTTGALLGLFVAQPFSTLKTILAIHWEALRICIKGGRYHSRPSPTNTASPGRMRPIPHEAYGPEFDPDAYRE